MKDSLLCFLCFVILLAGCQPATEEPNTEVIIQTALAETAAVKTLIVEKAAATIAAIPTETLTPTPTSTPTITPLPPVTAQLTLNAYCRSGPGTVYGQGTLLEKGDEVLVMGRVDDEAAWLMVQLPDGSDNCWVAKEALAITGETAWVEIVLAPPTPTAIPNWNGTWTTWYTHSAIEYMLTANFTQAGAQFNGIVTIGSGIMTLKGTVSADGMRVDGMLADPYQNHYFHLERDPNNLSQFRGKIWFGYDLPRPFCGTKISGGSKPSPCLP